MLKRIYDFTDCPWEVSSITHEIVDSDEMWKVNRLMPMIIWILDQENLGLTLWTVYGSLNKFLINFEDIFRMEEWTHELILTTKKVIQIRDSGSST